MPSPPAPELVPGKPVFLLGPTASGKSALAVRWARAARKQGPAPVILSMDSMQLYRGADIGTGKPTPEEREEFIHGGLDLADVGEPYDVAQYLAHAQDFLLQHEDRPVLIVGGTGLYYRALTRGLSDIPATPPELRKELSALKPEERLARLQAADPAICETLDLKNPRRVQRALEVVLDTGTSLLEWQRRNSPPVVKQAEAYLLQRDREALRKRIAKRVAAMFKAGWMEETTALVDRHGFGAVASFAAIGYGIIAHSLAEVRFDLEQFPDAAHDHLTEKVTQLTHQYARRQLTWFRREPKLTVLELE